MRAYNTIEEALEELRQGRMILVTDDPDRENEGDLICAAEFATTENVNFMAKSSCCPRWFLTTQTTTAPLSPFPLTMWTPPQAFPPKNVATPQENAWKTTQNPRISVVPVTCSL